MNWSLLIGLIVFLVVVAAARGAFPLLAKRKPPESDFVALPNRGSGAFDPANVPEFKSTWKDAR